MSSYVSLNPWFAPSKFAANDSILVPFLNNTHAHHFYFGEYKKSNGRLKEGTLIWKDNQEAGTYLLIGKDSSKWDVPIDRYEKFLELLFQEKSIEYNWFFVETMQELNKMYLDFDFKLDMPIDYDEVKDTLEFVCERVYDFFNKSAEFACISKCESYQVKKDGKYKSGIHIYFNNIVTNSYIAMKCRDYIVSELKKTVDDPDYDFVIYDWDEVIDRAVFDAEPDSKRGTLRLNNTYKIDDCMKEACKTKRKAICKFLKAK